MPLISQSKCHLISCSGFNVKHQILELVLKKSNLFTALCKLVSTNPIITTPVSIGPLFFIFPSRYSTHHLTMLSLDKTVGLFSPTLEPASTFAPRTYEEFLEVSKTRPCVASEARYACREKRLQKAVAAHESGMSIATAAQRHPVPRSILHDRVRSRALKRAKDNPHSRHEPTTRFTYDEEAVIRDWVVEQQFHQPADPPINVYHLQRIALLLLAAKGDSNLLEKDWHTGFIRRHRHVLAGA